MAESNPNKPRYSRRGFLKLALFGAVNALGGVGGVVYITQGETRWQRLEQHDIRIPDLPASFDGYTIVQLSDFHIEDAFSVNLAQRAIRTALKQEADLIVFTGDFVDHSIPWDAVVETLAPLTAPDGVYCVMGNHDYWTDAPTLRELLKDTPVTELRNESIALERGEDRLWLTGVDDIWEEHHDLTLALADVPDEEPALLLAHEPDFADEASRFPQIRLQLSGHSHGGQMRFPGIGAPVLPYLGQKYPYGLYQITEKMQVYTNRGVGMVHPRVRFNCRPEITVITLRG